MKYSFKKFAVLLLAVVLLFAGCVQEETPPSVNVPVDGPLVLTVAVGDAMDTLESAFSTAQGGETVLYHIYENLMRWEDDGEGHAKLVPGQAESYTVETDYAGNATYTFTLRNDIRWSDGQNVTSYQFAAAWQRIADPAYGSPYRELLSCIAGYDDVQSTGDQSLLAVSTPDTHTLVVRLKGSAPWFLSDVCAGAHTMPIRSYLPEYEEGVYITNGAYVVAEYSDSIVKLVKSEFYYDADFAIAEELRFVPVTDSESDHKKLLGGSLNFMVNLPDAVLEALAENKFWRPEPAAVTYGVIINTLRAPFDNADVRLAFRLAVDEQSIVDALGDITSRAAVGLIPYGAEDHSVRETEKPDPQSEDETNPDPNAPAPKPELKADACWDFRVHGEEIVTLDVGDDYETDCARARALLAGAGYLDGYGFPSVEYLYVDTLENRLVAEQLRAMWKKVLGVTVMLRAMTAEEYATALAPVTDAESGEVIAPPVFQMAATEFSAAYNTAENLLNCWRGSSEDNCSGYTSAAFDILMDAAAAAVAPGSYDAYLHDAEAILLNDAPVIPVFYRGGSYQLGDGLRGLHRAPNGVYFFFRVDRTVGK